MATATAHNIAAAIAGKTPAGKDFGQVAIAGFSGNITGNSGSS
ncbi:MAG: hypothetical protein AB7O54_14545 [Pseudomonadales bacterium]